MRTLSVNPVKLNEHPRSKEFAAWFAKRKSRAVPLSGDFYRIAGPKHTSAKDIVSGYGAWLGGGRWNPPGVMRVVYLSEQPETALKEANAHFRYYSLPPWTGMPRVVIGVHVEIGTMLDLTTGQPGTEMPEPMPTLLAEDWRAIMSRGEEATTQAIGRAAFDAGIQALRVPSKADPDGINLLVFPELLTKPARLKVLNADALDNLGQ